MTTSPHATNARTFYTSSGMMHLVAEVIETIENGYTADPATTVYATVRTACNRKYSGTTTRGAGDLDTVTCPRCRTAVDLMVAAAARLDALPTDDEVEALLDEVDARADEVEAERVDHETTEALVAQGVTTRTVGRDLYEVVVKGTAAGRVMMGATSWHGYDLAGTRITGLGVATLTEAVAAVVALGATPDHPHGATPVADKLAEQGTEPGIVEAVAAAEVGTARAPAHLRPALDAYGEAISAHGQTYGASPACSCGRPFRTRQGVGLHVTAEHKRAGREYDEAARLANDAHRLAERLRAGRPAGTTARERLAARHRMTVEQVAATTDEVLDGTPATDALDERPRPLDAGEVATAVATWGGRLGDGPAALAQLDAPSGTEWVVYCPRHRHYLVRASVTGTTWADEQAEARRYTRREAGQAAERATWLDHNPTPWALPSAGPALV